MAHRFNSGGQSSSPQSKINHVNSGKLAAIQMNTGELLMSDLSTNCCSKEVLCNNHVEEAITKML